MTTETKLPPIKATQHWLSSADFTDGGFRNTYRLFHKTANGESVPFGAMCEHKTMKGKKEVKSGRLFQLDTDPGTEYDNHQDFAAAYYAQYPERLAGNAAQTG